MKTGYLNQKSANPEPLSADMHTESASAKQQDSSSQELESRARLAPSTPPIYTVSKDTDEYHLRREQQYKDGLKTLIRSLLLFGILAIVWLVLQYSVK